MKALKSLNTLALEKLRGLLAETGHALSLDDLPSIMTMDQLARKVTEPLKDEDGNVVAMPVLCGNVTLSAPSIGRLIWWNARGAPWLASDEFARDLGLGYLCSNDASNAELWAMGGPREFRRRVMRWAKRLTADAETFAGAVLAVLPKDEADADDDGDGSDNIGGMIGLLVREYGNTPEYWTWDAPWPVVRAMLADWRAHCEANNKAQARGAGKAAAKRGGSVKPTAPIATPSAQALKRLRLYTNALRNRWKDQANG